MNAHELSARLIRWARSHESALVNELMRLTAVDAPSGDNAALERVADMLGSTIVAWGGTISRRTATPVGPILEARFGEGDCIAPLLLCHYDTVWPRGTAAARPPRLQAGSLHGPGTFDMRGGLIASLGALWALSELGALQSPVNVLLTPDEEQGSGASRDTIVRLAGSASLVIIPEPPLPGGGLKTSRKGYCEYEFEISGQAAHAGVEPERGVSAVHALWPFMEGLLSIANPQRGTTVNVGVVTGGTAPNVVADRATAVVDFRFVHASEIDRVATEIEQLVTRTTLVRVTATLRHAVRPMERTAAVTAAAGWARELARLVNLDLTEGATGGTGDANLLAPLGIAIVDGIGPEGAGAHALNEQVCVESLCQRCALIALLLVDHVPLIGLGA